MKRVQMHRGVKLPAGAKYVGRPTIWGNPWRAGLPSPDSLVPAPMSREEVVASYREWLAGELLDRPDMLEPLRGRDLACYCPLDQPCHADVLLELLA